MGEGRAAAKLADALPGYDLARSLFAHRRLVLRSADGLRVVRPGDVLPGEPGWRVAEISERRAVLVGRGAVVKDAADGAGAAEAGPASMPSQLVILEPSADGGVKIFVGSPTPPVGLLVEEGGGDGASVLLDPTTGETVPAGLGDDGGVQ